MTKAKITPIRREILDEIKRQGHMTTRQLPNHKKPDYGGMYQ